jgi:hypothetical protein
MELFIPSVLVLLLAAAVVFFVFPRFGAPVLAAISVGLLAFGIYQHSKNFGTEYRGSTWQYDIAAYAPFVMVGGVLLVISFYLLSLFTGGGAAPTAPEVPTVAEMPSANTATNAVTAGVNNALKGAANVMNNATKAANKAPNALAAPGAAANAAATAAATVATNAANAAKNALAGVTNAITGNGAKPNNKGGLANALGLGGTTTKPANNKGVRIPGLNFSLSQA